MNELVMYRLKSAKERLDSAKILLEAGKYKDSIGRSYYAIFTAVRAVLAKDEVDFSKHAGVISYFQREYIKTGIFDKKYSNYLQEAFQIRNNCDYAFRVSPVASIAETKAMGKPVALDARAEEREVRGLISMTISRSVLGSWAHWTLVPPVTWTDSTIL